MSIAEVITKRGQEDFEPPSVDDAICGPPSRDYLRWKGILDRMLALLLLLPGLPLMGVLCVLVWLTSRGPAIFRQTRVGRDGELFDMFKIRTMIVDAEAGTGAVWTAGKNDARITRVGRILRKLHLDELPQLFNVLRGEMSLVGPRPERPEFVPVLSEAIPGYEARLAMLPGVTGLAQINLPADTDLDSVRSKLVLDLEYIATASLLLDVRMLFCTLLRIFGLKGNTAMRLAAVQRNINDKSHRPLAKWIGAKPAPPTGDGSEERESAVPIAHSGVTPEQVAQQALSGGNGRGSSVAGHGPRVRGHGLRISDQESGGWSPESGVCGQGAGRASVAAAAPADGNGRHLHAVSSPALAAPDFPLSAAGPLPSGIFTVDVEDYYHVTAFEEYISRDRWSEFPSRVERNTHRMLDLLARRSVRATFFVLGWVAKRFPDLVQEIHAAGHEIASHGYWHWRVYHQTRDEFRRDVQQSRDVLMDITGQRVLAYRAPTFSITKKTLWALEILAEEGFEADCSVFPIRHDRYGIPGSERAPHRIVTRSGVLWQFPPATRRLAGMNLPVSGGGYFRLLPIGWTVRSLRTVLRQTGGPFTFYVHPWELDHDQPRLHFGSWASRRRHYLNLATTESKLDQLLEHFRFGRLDETMAALQAPKQCDYAKIPDNRELASGANNHRPGMNGKNGNGQLDIVRMPDCGRCRFCTASGTYGVPKCRSPVYRLR